MQAVNLTLAPVQLDPVNGPGLLAPATDDSDGRHVRELEEVTDREQALARGGIIALEDAKGRRRKPPEPDPPDVPADPTGGDGA